MERSERGCPGETNTFDNDELTPGADVEEEIRGTEEAVLDDTESLAEDDKETATGDVCKRARRTGCLTSEDLGMEIDDEEVIYEREGKVDETGDEETADERFAAGRGE